VLFLAIAPNTALPRIDDPVQPEVLSVKAIVTGILDNGCAII
jgi:hypothetical protein